MRWYIKLIKIIQCCESGSKLDTYFVYSGPLWSEIDSLPVPFTLFMGREIGGEEGQLLVTRPFLTDWLALLFALGIYLVWGKIVHKDDIENPREIEEKFHNAECTSHMHLK